MKVRQQINYVLITRLDPLRFVRKEFARGDHRLNSTGLATRIALTS